MTISAWFAVVLAIPVLVLGEFLVKRISVLSRFNIPAPVVGESLISLLVLTRNLSDFRMLIQWRKYSPML